jgi:hypothetical protein
MWGRRPQTRCWMRIRNTFYLNAKLRIILDSRTVDALVLAVCQADLEGQLQKRCWMRRRKASWDNAIMRSFALSRESKISASSSRNGVIGQPLLFALALSSPHYTSSPLQHMRRLRSLLERLLSSLMVSRIQQCVNTVQEWSQVEAFSKLLDLSWSTALRTKSISYLFYFQVGHLGTCH